MNYLYSIIPIILIGIFIYSLDKHKEPMKLLMKLFIGGFLSTFLVLLITIILKLCCKDITIINSNVPSIKLFINILITVGITEEISKWIATYLLSYNNKEFDELYDIIVYSVFVSLGFAALENVLYVTDSTSAIITAIVRGLLSIPAHTAIGIIMGSFLGFAKMAELKKNKKEKRINILLSIIIPIELHTIYDFCSVSTNSFIQTFLYIYIVLLYTFAVVIVREFIKKNIRIKK